MKEKGKITNKEYQELTGVSRITASRELQDIVEKEVLQMIGKVGKGTNTVNNTYTSPVPSIFFLIIEMVSA